MGGLETFVEVDRPLARDVVGDFDVPDLTTLEILGNNVISVDVAIIRLALLLSSRGVPYRSPRCKSPTAVGRTKQWRAQTALTTPLAR